MQEPHNERDEHSDAGIHTQSAVTDYGLLPAWGSLAVTVAAWCAAAQQYVAVWLILLLEAGDHRQAVNRCARAA